MAARIKMTQGSHKKRVLGYPDKLSVRLGERIEFKISSEDGAQYTAQLVQLINGDIYSTAASDKEVEIDSPINGKYRGRQQPVRPGSCIVVEPVHRLDGMHEMTVVISGADRCMFESNYPVDAATCSYRVLWNTFKQLAAGGSTSEKNALFSGTAARIYRIEL
jgi:hypothetical protein